MHASDFITLMLYMYIKHALTRTSILLSYISLEQLVVQLISSKNKSHCFLVNHLFMFSFSVYLLSQPWVSWFSTSQIYLGLLRPLQFRSLLGSSQAFPDRHCPSTVASAVLKVQKSKPRLGEPINAFVDQFGKTKKEVVCCRIRLGGPIPREWFLWLWPTNDCFRYHAHPI